MLTKEFNLETHFAENIIKLIDEDNTIPFIARYRKEQTGGVDDQVLREFSERLTYLRNLEKRKAEISASIEEQGKLTEEITKALLQAITLAQVEDIYLPYKKKRSTRGSIARERGLEPLAQFIMQADKNANVHDEAESYIDEEKGVPTREDAIQGALDIIAEDLSTDAVLRSRMRARMQNTAIVRTSAKGELDSVYSMYNDYQEAAKKIPSHRVLAINRGENEDMLKVAIDVEEDVFLGMIATHIDLQSLGQKDLITQACADSYKRLLFPSLERELRSELTTKASEIAIKNFSENLKNLLMQPPVKGVVTLGLDPAYRTGCKIAVVDETSKVLATTVVYPTPPQSKVVEAKAVLTKLIKTHNVTVIAIGNGTASRESEAFVAELIKDFSNVSYMIVSESGASVYSASKLAAEEFPEFDVSLRSAVSIARRLQDPLAELVKIDPKAIGVGQYQHDMPPARLSQALGGVVEDCVNSVGVDVNTASHSLLSYISGISATLAKNIVVYREENGKFKERKQLLKVAKLGKKAYEQCAGFLRISEPVNYLDNTGVHPESYQACEKLLEICKVKKDDLKSGSYAALDNVAATMGTSALAREIGVGEPTLLDIISELKKPGRDPRDELEAPLLRQDILTMKDLVQGMELMGTVRNVIDFGAFVDIGVHEDGLVHISQLSDSYVKHPSAVVKVGDVVKVRVLEVDTKRKRISLTMKKSK